MKENKTHTAESAWEKCLEIFKDVLEIQHFKAWFEPIQAVQLKDAVLTIKVPSQFFYEYLEENYLDLIAKTLKKIIGKQASLEYEITISQGSEQHSASSINLPGKNYDYKLYNNRNEANAPLVINSQIKNPFVIPGIRKVQIDPQLNPTYTFDNYIEGESNRVAKMAGIEVAQKLHKTSFNPLCIYGNVGLGKTHLANAIGNECKKLHPEKIVLYVSTEKFVTQFQHHARTGMINDFINFYQLIDVLILDDIQNFAKAEKTQEVLFTIFNHLHQSHKQIILTSDCFSKNIEGVQERLLDRFSWGLNIQLTQPTEEMRVEILQSKCKAEGCVIAESLLRFIAQHIVSNVRDLESVLLSILAESSFNKKEIDINLVKQCLQTFIKAPKKEVSIDNIQKIVCDYFNVPVKQLLEKTRKSEIVHARQITMYFSKKLTQNTLKVIGEYFGGKDHTTVMHSCKTVENQIEVDTEFKKVVLDLQNKIQITAGTSIA